MRKVAVSAVIGLMALWAGAGWAGDLTPSLALPLLGAPANVGSVAGEGAAPNNDIPGNFPNTAVQHLDWIVFEDATQGTTNPFLGGFIYFYQIENSSVADLTNLIIASPNFTAAGVLVGSGGGVAGGAPDLDEVGDLAALIGTSMTANLKGPGSVAYTFGAYLAGKAHDQAIYTDLAVEDAPGGEHEAGSSDCCVGPDSGDAGVSNASAAWTDLNLAPGQESGLLVGFGPRPGYFQWSTSGSCDPPCGISGSITVPSWSSQADNPGGEAGRPIAAPRGPVPQPSSLLMVGAGLAGFGILIRRRLWKS